MKRNSARMFLFPLTTLGVAYVSWCLHPFFIGAPLKIDPRIPPEAQIIVRQVHSDKKFNRRGFRWSSFAINLMHPSRAKHDKLEVNLIAPAQVALEVPGHKPWVFVTKDAEGHWVRTDDAT